MSADRSVRAVPGTLYVVGTPIGNLGDLSRRAAEILGSVDVVACEDTRRSRKLLTHLGLTGVQLISVPVHREGRASKALARRLADGESVAYVTDAGMPAVSDPGGHLVRAALEVGASVVPIPGASAALSALSISGLDTRTFHFLGFVPRRGSARRRLLEAASRWPGAIVLYESPQRVGATLSDLVEVFGPTRPAVLCRELTKLHEEVVRDTLAALAERFADGARGEVTLVVAGAEGAEASEVTEDEALEQVRDRVEAGARMKDACREVAEETGHPARALYQAMLEDDA